ncbi:MAG: DUF692 family protein [Caldilineaceae bacterium]
MKLAIHYSAAAAQLVHNNIIQTDLFKCPAWPDLLPTVQAILPACVHFPLKVGAGNGDALDMETKQPADWAKVEMLVAQTGTPFINLHLSPSVKDHPDVALNELHSDQIEKLTECLVHDVQAIVRRFGADRIIVENDYDEASGLPKAACLPEVITQVVKTTHCGFLCDLSHARLAALRLNMPIQAYIAGLPVAQIREIHITGIQRFEGKYVDLLKRGGIDDKTIQRYAGRLMDHLPMTKEDWTFFEWSMAEIHRGHWGKPWMIAFEYGGVGRGWAELTEPEILEEQAPRLYNMIKG